MAVFRNYSTAQAGGVIKNAFPRVHPIPWTPTQRNIRANPGIPSQPQRITPTERGSYFPGSSNGGGTLAPSMSSGCSSCGGCSGCGQSGATPGNPSAGPTPSDIATQHSFPTNFTTGPVLQRPPVKRGTGVLRRQPSPVGTISRPAPSGSRLIGGR